MTHSPTVSSKIYQAVSDDSLSAAVTGETQPTENDALVQNLNLEQHQEPNQGHKK